MKDFGRPETEFLYRHEGGASKGSIKVNGVNLGAGAPPLKSFPYHPRWPNGLSFGTKEGFLREGVDLRNGGGKFLRG